MAPNAKETEDPRQKVGGIVYALANKVIHASSCARRFGSLAGKKEFRGVVQEIITEKNEKTQRISTYVLAKYITGTEANGEESTKVVKLNIRSVKSKPSPLDDENIIPTSVTQKTQNLPPTAPEVIQPTVVHTATPNVASNNTGVVEISTGGGGNSPQSSLTSFTEAGSTIRGSIETIVTTEHPNQPPNTTTTLQLPPQQPNEIQQSTQEAT